MANSRTLSKRSVALYDDGVHWVSAAVSREFAKARFTYGVWRRLPERDECRRGFRTSDEAISIAQKLTVHALQIEPGLVGDVPPVPVSAQGFEPAHYGLALKRAISKAKKLMPAAEPELARPSEAVIPVTFDNRGFRVARYDGVFEHWVFDPLTVSVAKWNGRRGARSRPMHGHRAGEVILTRDGLPLSTDGHLEVFATLAHAEEWADEQIAVTPEDEYIPVRTIEGRATRGHGIAYERDSIVAWFQPGYALTGSEFSPVAKAPWAMPYSIFRKYRPRGSESITLHPLCPRRAYSPDKLDLIDAVTGTRKTILKGDAVLRDVEQPIRAASLATAIQAVDDIASGRRVHGYLKDIQLQGEALF